MTLVDSWWVEQLVVNVLRIAIYVLIRVQICLMPFVLFKSGPRVKKKHSLLRKTGRSCKTVSSNEVVVQLEIHRLHCFLVLWELLLLGFLD